MIRIAIIAAAATAALLPLAAQASDVAPTATVRTADLDLTSAAGSARFDRRLEGAVASVCPTGPLTGMLLSPEVVRCRVEARAGAMLRRAAMLAARPIREQVASR